MSTRRALALSFADRYAGLVLAILSSMLIARLLKPEEIGAFSVVMVLVSLVTALRDFGAGQYLLQEKDLTPARIQATWSVLMATGAFFALVVLLAAWPMAAFYADDRIVAIMAVLSASFLVNPVASLSYAWLMREMRFDALALMRLGAGLSGAVVSVGLAWLGHGPLSLALGTLAATVVNALVALHWRPASFSWRLDFRESRRVVQFGGRISATAFVTNLGNGVPELVLGKVQSLAHAAYFSRAFGLAGMFQKLVLDAAQSVAMPAFSRALRETGSLGPMFHLAIAHSCALGWSFFACLALLAQPVVLILYGSQWAQAVELTRWLAGAMVLGLPAVMIPLALNAAGAVDVTMRTTFKVVTTQAVLVGMSAFVDLRAVGAAFMLGQLASLLWWHRAARSTLGADCRTPWSHLARSAVVAAATAMPAVLVCAAWGWAPARPLLAVSVAAGSGIALFIVATLVTGHPLRAEVLRVLNRLRPAIGH